MQDTNSFKDSSNLLQLVSFYIGSEEFGVEILKVKEIIRLVPITKIPNAPEFIEGIINLRGSIIAVVDFRKRLHLNVSVKESDTRIIVVEIKNKTIGFIVDSVNEVLRIPADITETPPDIIKGIDSQFITSIAKFSDRLIILLDLDKILSDDEILTITN